MQEIQNDFVFLSLINTMLRDRYPCLEYLCEDENLDLNIVNSRLNEIGYFDNKTLNTFVSIKD